ncbi:MAG: zinc ABC transporter substrate-binding protein [Thermonemataceae bacterium]|nr:zinc ABC transporter substrate-binding protein [Thermonemataceae bacterium]
MVYIVKLLFFLFLFQLIACKSAIEEKNYILATTGMLYDITKNITDSTFKVDYLMGEGVDPHLYKFSQRDLQKLNKSTFIVTNGLHLEGKMNFVFEKLSRNKIVISVGDSVEKNKLIKSGGNLHDPHIWFDLDIWESCILVVSNNLQKQYPDRKYIIQNKTTNYISEVRKLKQITKKMLESIPTSNRVLITTHDAFQYFGKANKIEVKALQGISTASEFGIKDVNELVDFIIKRKIKALFVETTLSSKFLEAVQEGVRSKGAKVVLVEGLYADAMGELGTKEGTFLGMYESNVRKIVENLK